MILSIPWFTFVVRWSQPVIPELSSCQFQKYRHSINLLACQHYLLVRCLITCRVPSWDYLGCSRMLIPHSGAKWRTSWTRISVTSWYISQPNRRHWSKKRRETLPFRFTLDRRLLRGSLSINPHITRTLWLTRSFWLYIRRCVAQRESRRFNRKQLAFLLGNSCLLIDKSYSCKGDFPRWPRKTFSYRRWVVKYWPKLGNEGYYFKQGPLNTHEGANSL